ncbi:orotate phosphoribosyltransferase [Salinibacter grassmerensis]|uniref:orotate phosphoribosyltransferase n=1 Tax=Salinibacter grassmerensis TaxID=3040353 RepID=UPI0021E948AD|nr:orotate phosphoribosyltransferase [Salinibacter grassmerensis]
MPTPQEIFAPSSADRARALADTLLNIEAVFLRPRDPFTWSSGLAAPIYCDNRQTLAHPSVRERIANGFTEIVRDHDWTSPTVAGTATAGIPHAAWLADRIDAPMAYIRSSAKGHGQGRRIEGAQPGAGDTVIVVEDLISTGRSVLDAVAAVRETGATVPAVLAIFSYGLDAAATAFREAGVPCHVLTTFPVLLDVAHRQHALSEDAQALLNDWRADPDAWSQEHGG